MNKLYIILYIMLIIIPLSYALECTNPISPEDIPCDIVSSWEYGNCSDAEAKVYDDSPELKDIRSFDDYGNTNRCNITWNYTSKGSYYWNVSNGDSGRITVKEDGNMILGFMMGILTFGLLNYFIVFKKSKIIGAFGFFALSLATLVPFNDTNYLIISWVAIGITLVGFVVSIAYSKSQQIAGTA